MSIPSKIAAVTLLLLLSAPLFAYQDDLLQDFKARQKIEAERVEKEFTAGRSAAYKLVRSETPRVVEATEKLESLLAMVRNDTALDTKRREVLIVTLKWDLDKIKDIARERRASSVARDLAASRITQTEIRSSTTRERTERRGLTDDVRSIIDSRSRMLADARGDRLKSGDRFNRVMRSVDESSIPESSDYKLPKNWVELSKKRSSAVKMTEKERLIMKSLNTTMEVDFMKHSFQDVLDYIRRRTGVEISVDKRALTEVGASYESEITLKMRASTRTILKRILADLNLTYVVKDEAIHVTSRERANQMTVTRSYYLGDLVAVVDFRYPPVISQLIMIENVNRLIAMITQTFDPNSWKINNPDAVGAIVFDPVTMTIVVKQTAENHFLLGGFK